MVGTDSPDGEIVQSEMLYLFVFIRKINRGMSKYNRFII